MAQSNYFDHEFKPLYQRTFSDDFKRKKIKELERNLTSISDICRTYSVSRTSVYKWIYKYSTMAKKQEKQIIEAKSDTKRIQALEEKIKELERTIGQKQVLLEFKEKMIDIAENTYGIDIKKKFGSKLSPGSTSNGKSIK
jgi:transposase-like protein